MRLPSCPNTLSAKSKRRWKLLLSRWELNESELQVLEEALCCADRADQAAAEVKEHGLLIQGPHGLTANPALKAEASARALYLRAMRQLGLKEDGDKKRPGRPARRF